MRVLKYIKDSGLLHWLFFCGFTIICLPLLFMLIRHPSHNKTMGAMHLDHSRFVSTSQPAYYRSQAIPLFKVPFQHAVSLLKISANTVLAAWYAGSAEHKPDVKIMLARYNLTQQRWYDIHQVMSRDLFIKQQKSYIHTLGNPVLVKQSHTIYLYFVSTFSGWSTSSINVIASTDLAKHWGHIKTLYTSAFFNISTLLKTAAIHYNDGSIALPVYHELFNKNALLLHINHMKILGMSRITWDKHTLQPLLLPLSSHYVMALMRDNGKQPRHIQLAFSSDAGAHWVDQHASRMPNPDAAITGDILWHKLFVIMNPSMLNRHSLVMANYDVTNNQWHSLYTIAHNHSGSYSYPYLISLDNGYYMLGYSKDDHIETVVFNKSWLKKRWY